MLADEWGQNRNINVGLATNAERHAERAVSPEDPDLLPGTRDVGELDGPGGEEGRGYIWDAVLRAGLQVRNYGFYGLLDWSPPLLHDPATQQVRVFYPTKPALRSFTDPYYRGFDPRFPDFWRYREWRREFTEYSAQGALPALSLLQLGNDHTGAFSRAIDGVNTPETQMADNDYALGLIVEAVARSPFADDTLVIAVEDDTSDGPDHADVMRSVALVAGPYVRQHALVSTRYTTVSLVKTIEAILGIGPLGLNDALAQPMTDIFDPSVSRWSYTAVVPNILRSTQLPIPATPAWSVELPTHTAAYWARAMAGEDFSAPDRLNNERYNRALWSGLKGGQPFPTRQAKQE